ncbi:MAG: DUF5074 domain-containing protein [Bacteroidales bacterium]|nr:DUF5074 domain-containing protein [Bacteroidales bacterium]
MKKILLLFVIAASLLAVSCHKDDEQIVIPELLTEFVSGGEYKNDVLTVCQGNEFIFKVLAKNLTNYSVRWVVDGNLVSSSEELKMKLDEVGEHILLVTVINKDGGEATKSIKIVVYGKFKQGTFILNEGNMSNENGTLIFISEDGVATDSVYIKANNSQLGNVAQDLFISKDKIYFICQNGAKAIGELPSDGMLIIADAQTLKKKVSYQKESLAALSWPTHVAAIEDNIYIRDNYGISLFKEADKSLTLIDGTSGASMNRMVVAGERLFAAAGKKLLIIKGDAVEKTIEMDGTISGVVKASDGNIYISVTSNPAQILKIKASDGEIIKKNIFADASIKIGAGWGASPAFGAKGDTLYFSNATTKIYRHIFSTNTNEYITDVKEFVADASIVYNNLGVHPITGEVYFNSIKSYANYKKNDISVFNFSKATPVLKQDYKDFTNFPAGIFFTYNFE